MRLKALLVSAAIAATIVPLTSANATHCGPAYGGTNKVLVFSYVVVSLDSNSVGCTAYPTVDDADTDYILPRSSGVSARYLSRTQPINGFSTFTFSGIVPTGLNCLNSVCPMTFTTNPAGSLWDSQFVPVDALTTLTGGSVTASMCFEVTDDVCTRSESHTYKTVG